MTDSCRWNYNYWCVCFSICLLFSLLLFSPVARSRGAAHVVSSGLHYAGLTAGSLINGWSQRGQTQELRGSCTQQHPAHSTTIQCYNNYMWVPLIISTPFFSPGFCICTGTEGKNSFNIISSLITWQSTVSVHAYGSGSHCGFLSYKQEVTENEVEETSEPDDVSLHSSSHTHNHEFTHTFQNALHPRYSWSVAGYDNAAGGY